MKLIPNDGRVIVTCVSNHEKKTPGGIILPDREVDTEKEMMMGKVLDVGKGVKTKTNISIGNMIFFASKHAFPFQLHGNVFYAIEAENIQVIGERTAEDEEIEAENEFARSRAAE